MALDFFVGGGLNGTIAQPLVQPKKMEIQGCTSGTTSKWVVPEVVPVFFILIGTTCTTLQPIYNKSV